MVDIVLVSYAVLKVNIVAYRSINIFLGDMLGNKKINAALDGIL